MERAEPGRRGSIGGAGAPAGAHAAEVHVIVEVVVSQQAVGDVVDEVRR